MSVERKRFKTAEAEGPVPPVFMRVLLVDRDIWVILRTFLILLQ